MTTSVTGIFAAMSRLTRVALGIAMMPALSTLAAHAANMGHMVPAQSPNWAGFLTQSPRGGIQGAYGNWVVPSVRCPSGATTSSSLWVGIGGDTAGSYEAGGMEWLYQGGTSQDCDNGKASYHAWTEEADGVSPELARRDEQVVAYLVEPGDVIAAAAVQHELETLVTLQDARRGQVAWKTSRQFYLTQFQHEEAGRTAECIMEAPLIPGRGEAPLADFGTAHFSYCQASDNAGRVYNFDGPAAPSNWEPVAITMTINAQVIATPNPSLLSVSYTSLPAGPPGYAPQAPYCMPSGLRPLQPGQRATVIVRMGQYRAAYRAGPAAHMFGLAYPGSLQVSDGHTVWVLPAPAGLNSYLSFEDLCLLRFGPEPAPEVMAVGFTGGAHCCSVPTFYAYSSAAKRYVIAQDFARPGVGKALRWDPNGGFAPRRLGHAIVLQSDDGAFAYQFGCYACTPAPVHLFTFEGSGLVDVTDAHLSVVQAEASGAWSSAQKVMRSPGERAYGLEGLIAQWSADECDLHEGAAMWRTVEHLSADGEFSGITTTSSKMPFPAQLRMFLLANGYCQGQLSGASSQPEEPVAP